MATSPNLLDQLKDTGGAVVDALKSRYLAGPSSAPLTPGPGSVLDRRDTQMNQLLPQMSLMPAAQSLAPAEVIHSQGQYGSGPGEKRIDVTEYMHPLGGLKGIKRK